MRASLTERLFSRVGNMGGEGCWTWEGSFLRGGYGRVGSGGKTKLAHRVAYELLEGPIPEGLTLDHLCRKRACVRPSHLEPVTNRTNSLRGVGPTAVNAAKESCGKGHPFCAGSTGIGITRGFRFRRCLPCHAEQERRRKAARRSAHQPAVEEK